MNFHLDYETRSRAELEETGAYRYAEDKSTEILCFAISCDELNEGPYLWVNPKFECDGARTHPRAFVLLQMAFEDRSSIIYAWNAQFERAVTMYQGPRHFGLQIPHYTQWRCTAAMARKAALHGSLEQASRDLNVLFEKDTEGEKLKPFFCWPDSDGDINEPTAHPEKFARFCQYNVNDVYAETNIHIALKPFELRASSLDTYLLDTVLNDRGLPVNVKACRTARVIIDEFLEDKAFEFSALTGLKPTQRAKVKAMLLEHGVDMPDMKQPTIEARLPKLTGRAREILQGYAELNFAAAKKIHSILNCVNSDGRVRGTLLYHGAHTGRWAGRLIQPQNFKKPTIKNTDLAYKMICEGCTREQLAMVFGNPLEVIASCVRHFIQDPDGMILDADYAQIECRIVCWLAGQHDALAAFASGEDQYIKMAAKIYETDPARLVAEYKATGISKERDLGKQAVLGCGFQMWWPKFKQTCAKFKIIVTDELAMKAVKVYREEFDQVVRFWYDTDRAARNAITCPGKSFVVGKISFIVRKVGGIDFLCLTLPSKRVIVYPHPKVEITEKDIKQAEERNAERTAKHQEKVKRGGDFGYVALEEPKASITFYGQIEGNHWGRISTYGGKLVENATQATAGDVMSFGMQNAERLGFRCLTTIHDQALARPRDYRDLKAELVAYIEALKTIPEWAKGCPINADGKIVPYYKK